MKKVVNGRVYDTDMAQIVVSWSEESYVAGVKAKVSVGLHRNYVLKTGAAPEEVLKTNSWGGLSVNKEKVDETKGEFFLSYETGSWNEESRRIVPVPDDQAKEIIERRCSFEDYVSLFGDPRGLIITPDAVKKAVSEQHQHDCDEKRQVEKDRDEAKVRVYELEARIRELENR